MLRLSSKRARAAREARLDVDLSDAAQASPAGPALRGSPAGLASRREDDARYFGGILTGPHYPTYSESLSDQGNPEALFWT